MAERKFDFPDEMPVTMNAVATYIPDRDPQFKVHTTEGLAHSAIGGRSYSEPYAKYMLVDGVWKKVFEYQPAQFCNWCKAPFTTDQWNRIVRREPPTKIPRWKKAPICVPCYDTAKEQLAREERETREREQYRALHAKYGG